jgi:hypothetical protein
MCTLTYYPTDEQGFILTHNRDELKLRGIAEMPKYYEHANGQILFPKDKDAGGTWIGLNDKWSVCLLNGAFERYQHQPPYRMSRGLILLSVFNFNKVPQFLSDVSFEGIAPFTMIIAANSGQRELHEIVWDGKELYYSAMNAHKAQIWSAATLYIPIVREQRENWFNDFQKKYIRASNEQLIDFHKFGGVGDPSTNMIMSKKMASTVSISQIRKSSSLGMWYHDLIKDRKTECLYSDL